MWADIGSRLFSRGDLLPELIGLRLYAPVNVFANECHIVVVGFSISVKDSNLLAHVLEGFGIERRFAGG